MEKYLKKVDPNVLATLGSGAVNYLTSPSTTTPVYEQPPSPAVQNIFDIISTLNGIKIAITVILILWGISRIIVEFLPDDLISEKQKKNSNYVNKVLFGDIGIIPMIFIIWVLILIISTIIPALIDISPKFSSLLSGFNRFISSITGIQM